MKIDKFCLLGMSNEERVKLFEFVLDFEKNHNAGVCACTFHVGNYCFRCDLDKQLVTRM